MKNTKIINFFLKKIININYILFSKKIPKIKYNPNFLLYNFINIKII